MEYHSTIKNTFESVLMKWMNLEPIIQRGWLQNSCFDLRVSQAEQRPRQGKERDTVVRVGLVCV